MATFPRADGVRLTAGFITAHEAAKRLNRSYSHVMHMLERGELSGLKLFDRWLLSPDDLAAYRNRRYGAHRDLARAALDAPHARLTARQQRICEALACEKTLSEVARDLGISRQAVHAQLSLIRRKLGEVPA
jgi:excisionase family DNA binding protein